MAYFRVFWGFGVPKWGFRGPESLRRCPRSRKNAHRRVVGPFFWQNSCRIPGKCRESVRIRVLDAKFPGNALFQNLATFKSHVSPRDAFPSFLVVVLTQFPSDSGENPSDLAHASSQISRGPLL